jgi:hypothetical protein
MLVTPHITLTYKNSAGGEMGFNFYSDFVIEKCYQEQPNNIYATEQAEIDGEFFTGMRMSARTIRLHGYVRNGGVDLHTAKRALGLVFNPTLNGVLTYTHALLPLATKSIPCRLVELSEPTWDNSRGKLTFDVILTALDPFWKGVAHTEIIAKNQRKWRFGTILPPVSTRQLPSGQMVRSGGFMFDIRRQGLTSRFDNIGNVRSGFEATFRSIGGTVTNPEIYDVTTGRRILIRHVMQPGDIIHITNTAQLKQVLINSNNAFNTLHTRADNFGFFLIEVGQNHIGFRAAENVSNLQVSITYTPQFTLAEC